MRRYLLASAFVTFVIIIFGVMLRIVIVLIITFVVESHSALLEYSIYMDGPNMVHFGPKLAKHGRFVNIPKWSKGVQMGP